MNGKAHGQLRRSQVITTFGPGSPDRPARRIRHRGRARHLGRRDEPGTDRRAAPRVQADLHDGRARSEALCAAAGA